RGGEIKEPRRRKHTRIPIQVAVRYRLADSTEFQPGELVEISLGGGLIRCDQPPQLEREIVLSLLPPGGIAPMEIAARVAYRGGEGRVGVKFMFRDGGGARRLRELIRRIRTT